MKKVVEGKRYDTETAVRVGEADNLGHGVDSISDFGFWKATLYKTPKAGAYFLAGQGGPMSRFGRASGVNTWSGGSDILPLSDDDAMAWAEKHLDVGTVEYYFSDRIQDA